MKDETNKDKWEYKPDNDMKIIKEQMRQNFGRKGEGRISYASAEQILYDRREI